MMVCHSKLLWVADIARRFDQVSLHHGQLEKVLNGFYLWILFTPVDSCGFGKVVFFLHFDRNLKIDIVFYSHVMIL